MLGIAALHALDHYQPASCCVQETLLFALLEAYKPSDERPPIVFPDEASGPEEDPSGRRRRLAQAPDAASPDEDQQYAGLIPDLSSPWTTGFCPDTIADTYLIHGSVACPSMSIPVLVGVLMFRYDLDREQLATLHGALAAASPTLEVFVNISIWDWSAWVPAAKALSPEDRLIAHQIITQITGRQLTVASAAIAVYRYSSPEQMIWAKYAVEEFSASFVLKLVDHHDQWDLLTQDVAAQPPWLQVAFYTFVVNAKAWDWTYIDTGVPIPPGT